MSFAWLEATKEVECTTRVRWQLLNISDTPVNSQASLSQLSPQPFEHINKGYFVLRIPHILQANHLYVELIIKRENSCW